MTDRNTLSTKWFILIHIAGAILFLKVAPAIFELLNTIYYPLFSILVLFFECLITLKKRRNLLTIVINMLLPFELALLYSYSYRNQRLVSLLCIIWFLFSMCYSVLVIQSRKRPRKARIIATSQIRWIIHGCKTLFVLIMIISVLSFYHTNALHVKWTQVTVDELQCTEAECMDSLVKLNSKNWEKLTRTEKMGVLRDVLRIEFSSLHISHGFSLTTGSMDDESLAQYSDKTYTVTINDKYFDNETSFSLYHAMCHESYHAYQHMLINGEDPLQKYTEKELSEIVQIYRVELMNYYTPHDNLKKYRKQTYEIDAERYADKSCMKYLFYSCSSYQN